MHSYGADSQVVTKKTKKKKNKQTNKRKKKQGGKRRYKMSLRKSGVVEGWGMCVCSEVISARLVH